MTRRGFLLGALTAAVATVTPTPAERIGPFVLEPERLRYRGDGLVVEQGARNAVTGDRWGVATVIEHDAVSAETLATARGLLRRCYLRAAGIA